MLNSVTESDSVSYRSLLVESIVYRYFANRTRRNIQVKVNYGQQSLVGAAVRFTINPSYLSVNSWSSSLNGESNVISISLQSSSV